tara:strand:- start:383 stop:1159 length:777 start_codon:yes stop_codon:yes gene_type:complete
MGKFFTVEVKPDIVGGDISDVIADDKTDAPFSAGDVLFDWHAFDIPKGSAKLESVCAYVMGEDGGQQADTDIHLVFAKTVNGNAPASLGSGNAIMTTGFDMPAHLVGACKLEGTTEGQGTIDGPAFGQVYIAGPNSANGMNHQGILTGEPESGDNVGFDKLYVAGFSGGTLDFSTGVLSTGAITAEASATIAVDTVDARKCFQVGDTVYIHDVDTAAGTVKSVASGSIVLEAVTAVAVANNDEIINATPIKLVLGFER